MLINLEAQSSPILIDKEPKRMLEVLQTDEGTVVNINYSSLSIMQSCPRKAQLALDRGLFAKHDSPALLFGSALHKALEVFYAAPREERVFPKSLPDMKKDFELMAFGSTLPDRDMVALNVFYRAVGAFIEAAKPLSALPDSDKRSILNGTWILSHYFDTYKDDPYTVLHDDKGPMVERHLELPLHREHRLQINVHGQIDVVLKNEAQDQIVPADHKTSSMMGQDFYNRLKPNHQYSCYTWLAQEGLGIDRDLFMVNGIEVKAKPKTSRGSGPKFPRQITRRTEEDILDFKAAMVYWTHQYLEWKEQAYFPVGHVDVCSMWGGCQFHKICSSPESIRENIISADYSGGINETK